MRNSNIKIFFSFKLRYIILLCAVYCGTFHNLLFASESRQFYCGTKVIGYYPNWNVQKLPISQIRYDKFSHLIYFSICPKADGSLDLSQISLNNQQSLVAMAHSRGVKVSICVGGWGLSDNFSQVAADPVRRAVFISNLKKYCISYGLDGIDLDWEPVTATQDKSNYVTLVKELKSSITSQNLLLSVAVGALGSEITSDCAQYIDWVGVMAYDMGYPHSSYEDSINALIHWQGRGFAESKIMLGMPFYGRRSDWSYYAYNTIISAYNPDPDIDEIDGIFFNGVNTIKRKTQFVIYNSYAGVTIWEICEDSVSPSSLLTAVSDSIHANSSMDINCSGKVDILDFARLAENYLNSTCLNANAWCDNCDKNLSGQIDYYDLAIFAEQWLCN